MGIKLLREPSETPNINNTDDFIGLRYAYGNRNGYVKGYKEELEATINNTNNTVRVGSGRIVIQGVEVEIDVEGVTFNIDNIGEDRYYSIYCRVHLSDNSAQLFCTYDTTSFPTIPTSDDLTENQQGYAYIELYTFRTTEDEEITALEKMINVVEYDVDLRLDGNTLKLNTLTIPTYTKLYDNLNNTASRVYISNMYDYDYLQIVYDDSRNNLRHTTTVVAKNNNGTTAKDYVDVYGYGIWTDLIQAQLACFTLEDGSIRAIAYHTGQLSSAVADGAIYIKQVYGIKY